MTFLIGILTVILLLVCLLLILLVLIQLPKKEAGAGLAFGGAATDALFGAGSGNALTKMTKWMTVAFFVLVIAVGFLQSQSHHKSGKDFERAVEQSAKTPSMPMAPAAPATAPTAPATETAPPVTAPANPAPTPAPEPPK